MRRWVLAALVLMGISFSLAVFASDPAIPQLKEFAENIGAFVPKDWGMIEQAEGDLNKDGLPDLAGVLEYTGKGIEEGEAPPRILFILLREKTGYRLSVQTEKAILRSNEGGVWGDPFEDISVDRGSVLLSFYGGSNWRWANRYRFRFQDGDWYLIGATTNSYFSGTGEGEQKDYNLLTGKMIKTTTDKKGKVKAETTNRGRKKLVPLSGFDVYTADEQY